MFRHEFDLPGHMQEYGSISWTKTTFSHNKADYRIKNYYANQSLLEVTTVSNLLVLLAILLK